MATVIACGIVPGAASASQPGGDGLDVEINKEGIAQLRYDGVNLLADGGGTFRLIRAVLRSADGSTGASWGGKDRVTRKKTGPRSIRNRYDWGTVRCRYEVGRHRLGLIVEVINTSDQILKEVCLAQHGLRFPDKPEGLVWPSGMSPMRDGTTGPPVHLGDFGKGIFAYCNEQLRRPLGLGVWEKKNHRYALRFWTGRITGNENHPYIDRPIYPGGRERFRLSLRFGPPGHSPSALVGDVLKAARRLHPRRVDWPDRRPIGMVMVANPGRRSETNPRGYLVPNEFRPVDATTQAGRKRFRQAMLQRAEDIIDVCTGIDAQGLIVWDLEGGERTAAKYMGDPRSLPPEMDAAADPFFRKLRDAGLRVGVCVRWRPRPVRPAYGETIQQQPVYNPTRSTIRKIAYAKERWGCTLFYIDSMPGSEIESLRKIHEAHPDVLLIPEHAGPYAYAYGAPYHGVRRAERAHIPASPIVRALYPDAFRVLSGAGAPLADDRRPAALKALRRGDVPMMRGWVRSPAYEPLRKTLETLNR